MAAAPASRMHYLSVNADDYLRPLRPARKRFSRSASSTPRGSVSFEDGSVPGVQPELNKATSTRSLHMFDQYCSSDSSPNSMKLYKSMDNLCFSMTKKKVHKKAQISEETFRTRSNTDPCAKMFKKHWQLPTISIPETDMYTVTPAASSPLRRRSLMDGSSALGSLIEQTLKVTTASMGLNTGGTDNTERLTQLSTRSLNEDVKRKFSRSTSSVSALAHATSNGTSSMAPLQSHAEAQSVAALSSTSQQQQQQSNRPYSQQLSAPVASTRSGYSSANSSFNESYQNLAALGNNQKNETRSLRNQSSSSLNPLASVASSASLRSISPSRKSYSSNGSNTAKHEQQSTAAATAAAAASATGSTATPPEKEKKRKEVSSSRVKKFHRHFSQVSKDEKLINYYSCALVSDILLQGHLYITDQHFAFYSNVFGYVTKVVIPTSSVTKISKEKTAKIIPNAVGVATADERHVFGSFISREAAFRLMCSVCPPLAPAEILPKAPADIEISEEYSIEDDSSCSISGNESPPQLLGGIAANGSVAAAGDNGQTLLRHAGVSSSLNITDGKRTDVNEKLRHSDIPANAKILLSSSSNQLHANVAGRIPATANAQNSNKTNMSPVLNSNNNNKHVSLLSTPTTGAAASAASNLTMIIAGSASTTTSASSSPTPSTSSSPTTVMATTPKSVAQAASDSFKALSKQALLRLKFPTELNVVYLGVLLSLVLALFSVFLLFRILNIEAKTSLYRSSVDFNWRSGNDDDIFAEALRWQKELQSKSTEEAQSILNTNLEQIAKVRRSLETLSMLIHDRSSSFDTAHRDDSD